MKKGVKVFKKILAVSPLAVAMVIPDCNSGIVTGRGGTGGIPECRADQDELSEDCRDVVDLRGCTDT